MSADAFLEGLTPHNRLQMLRVETQPWFALPRTGLSQANPEAVRQAILDAIGMPLETARLHYRPAMEAVERQLCIPLGRLSEQPWEVELGPHGVGMRPLWIFNQIVETVRMQYTGDMPRQDVGFGSVVDQAGLKRLMALHELNYAAVKHPRYLAVRAGSALLSRLVESLSSQSDESVFVYVGYDLNIASIRSVLGFDWNMPDHLLNDVGPGGMLMFERVQHVPSGDRFVRVSYHAQTSDQIRDLVPLGDTTPPFSTVFAPPPSFLSPGANLIPLHYFQAFVARAVSDARDTPPTPSPQISPANSPQMTLSFNRQMNSTAPACAGLPAEGRLSYQ